MSDLPASHYLNLYTLRVRMSEEGKTHPQPGIIEGTKRLVEALEKMHPTELVHVEAGLKKAIFTKASTGELRARVG